jgi:hypothetical protein
VVTGGLTSERKEDGGGNERPVTRTRIRSSLRDPIWVIKRQPSNKTIKQVSKLKFFNIPVFAIGILFRAENSRWILLAGFEFRSVLDTIRMVRHSRGV